MITNISKKLLVAALTLSTLACSQLDAMKRLREESSGNGQEETTHIKKKFKSNGDDKIGRNIILRISPLKESFIYNGKEVKGLYETIVEGFRNDQVALKKDVVQAKIDPGAYPLFLHQKLNYFNPEDTLTILQYDIEVTLDQNVKDRILRYLCHDASDKSRDCFDFVNETIFDLSKKNDRTLFNDLSSCDEKGLKVGDGVTLFVGEKGSESTKHHALYLGNGLYISKVGMGGVLAVTTMDCMMEVYKTTGFYKILPTPLARALGEHLLPVGGNSVGSIVSERFDDNDFYELFNDECFNLSKPEEILNLIRYARKILKMNTKTTFKLVRYLLMKIGKGDERLGQILKRIRNAFGQTVLHFAILQIDLDSVRIIYLLAGDDFFDLIRSGDSYNNTPFYLAFKHDGIAWVEYRDIAKLLITIAGDKAIDLKNLDGRTALHHAAFRFDCDMIEFILKTAANNAQKLASMKDKYGLKAFNFIVLSKARGHIDDITYEKLEGIFKKYNALELVGPASKIDDFCCSELDIPQAKLGL